MDLHQRFQPLGERRFAASDRSEQIKNLLTLLQALGGMPKEPDDPLDRVFHAMESGEGRIDPHRPVEKNTAKAGILGRIDHLRFADRC